MKRQFALFVMLIFLLVTLILSALWTSTPTYAAIDCPTRRHVENWTNRNELEAHGFYLEQYSSSAAYSFLSSGGSRYLALDLGTTADNSYAASRITEIDTSVPVSQRIKCWQPTTTKSVVAEYTIRFDLAQTPFLTENVFLWNAPFGADPIPLTAFGVTRSAGSGGQYAAIVAEDVTINPDMSVSGNLTIVPMPVWLDASAWHTVRVTITHTTATVEVKQGAHSYTVVLSAQLSHPPEPVGLEYSVDNELFPGFTIPVAIGDGVDVGPLDIRLTK